MKLLESEKNLILEALLKFEHELGEEFEKYLKEKDYELQNVMSKRIDEVDGLIEKIRKSFEED